jgi:hypothetical protein
MNASSPVPEALPITSSAALELVGEYRRAARIAVDAVDRPLRVRLLALMDLTDAARREPDPWVRSHAEICVWEEARPLVGAGDQEPAIPGDPVEVAARQLRAKGYAACPECARPLHGELDFQRWASIRKVSRDREQARRRAIG